MYPEVTDKSLSDDIIPVINHNLTNQVVENENQSNLKQQLKKIMLFQ